MNDLGWQIAVTGADDERTITQGLLQHMQAPAVDLTGHTDLGTLAALVAQCRLVVCNDTGISHVAAAVGTPSVVVAAGSDDQRWAPLNHELHFVVAHAMPCRPCMFANCPIPGHPCATSVTPNLVQYQALRQLAASRPDDVEYSGANPAGIVVVNHLVRRGRRLGADIFDYARQQVALDLVGMDAESAGGLGEISNRQMTAFMAQYRYFFNPIRYTSLGLAVIEAMMAGLPIIGLATTEMATVVRNHETGYVDTRPERLVEVMRRLAADTDLARGWGIEHREIPADDPVRRRPDITTAQTHLHWQPQIGLDEGLHHTIVYFRDRHFPERDLGTAASMPPTQHLG